MQTGYMMHTVRKPLQNMTGYQLHQRNINNIQVGDEVWAPVVVKLNMTGSLSDFYCHVLDKTGNIARSTKKPPLFVGTVPLHGTDHWCEAGHDDRCGDNEQPMSSHSRMKKGSQRPTSQSSFNTETGSNESGAYGYLASTKRIKPYTRHCFSVPREKLQKLRTRDTPGTRFHQRNSRESKIYARRTPASEGKKSLDKKRELVAREPHYTKPTIAFNQMVYERQVERLVKSNRINISPSGVRRYHHMRTSPRIRIASGVAEAQMLLRKSYPNCDICEHKDCPRASKNKANLHKCPGTIQETGKTTDARWLEKLHPDDLTYLTNSKLDLTSRNKLPHLSPKTRFVADEKRKVLDISRPQSILVNSDSNAQSLLRHQELQTVNSYPSGPFYSIQGSKLLKMASSPTHPFRPEQTRSSSMGRERETAFDKFPSKVQSSEPTLISIKPAKVEFNGDKLTRLISDTRFDKSRLGDGRYLCSIKPEKISFLEETIRAKRRPATEMDSGLFQPLMHTRNSSKELIPPAKSTQVLRKTMVADVEAQQSVFHIQNPLAVPCNVQSEQSQPEEKTRYKHDINCKHFEGWIRRDTRDFHRPSYLEIGNIRNKDKSSSSKMAIRHVPSLGTSEKQKLIWDQESKNYFWVASEKKNAYEAASGTTQCELKEIPIRSANQSDHNTRISNSVPMEIMSDLEPNDNSTKNKLSNKIPIIFADLEDRSRSDPTCKTLAHIIPRMNGSILVPLKFLDFSKSCSPKNDFDWIRKDFSAQYPSEKVGLNSTAPYDLIHGSQNGKVLLSNPDKEAILSVKSDALLSVLSNTVYQQISKTEDTRLKDNLTIRNISKADPENTEGPIKRRNHLNIFTENSKGFMIQEQASESGFTYRPATQETGLHPLLDLRRQDQSVQGSDLSPSFEYTSSASLSFPGPTPSSEESLHLLNDTTLEGASQISSVCVPFRQTVSPSKEVSKIKSLLQSANENKCDQQKLIDRNGSSQLLGMSYEDPKTGLLGPNKSTLHFSLNRTHEFDYVVESLLEICSWYEADKDRKTTNSCHWIESPDRLFLCTAVGPIFTPGRHKTEKILDSEIGSSPKSTGMHLNVTMNSRWPTDLLSTIKTSKLNLLHQVVNCWSNTITKIVDSCLSTSFCHTLRSLFKLASVQASLYDILRVLNRYFGTEIRGIITHSVLLSSNHACIFSRLTRPKWLNQNSKEYWYSLAEKSEEFIQLEWIALHTIFVLGQRLLANKANLLYKHTPSGSHAPESSTLWEQYFKKRNKEKFYDQSRKQAYKMYVFVIQWLFKKRERSGNCLKAFTHRSLKKTVKGGSSFKHFVPGCLTPLSRDRIITPSSLPAPEPKLVCIGTNSDLNHGVQDTQCSFGAKSNSRDNYQIAEKSKAELIDRQLVKRLGKFCDDTHDLLRVEQEFAWLCTDTYYHTTSEEAGSFAYCPQTDLSEKVKGDEKCGITLDIHSKLSSPSKELNEGRTRGETVDVSPTSVFSSPDRIANMTLGHLNFKPSVSEKCSEYHTYRECENVKLSAGYMGIPHTVDRVEVEYRHEKGGDVAKPRMIVEKEFWVSDTQNLTVNQNSVTDNSDRKQWINLFSSKDCDSFEARNLNDGFKSPYTLDNKPVQSSHENNEKHYIQHLITSQEKPNVEIVGCSPTSWLEVYSINFVSACGNQMNRRNYDSHHERRLCEKSAEARCTNNKTDLKKEANPTVPVAMTKLSHRNYQNENGDKFDVQPRSTSFDPIGSTAHGIDPIRSSVSYVTSHLDDDWTTIVPTQTLNHSVEMSAPNRIHFFWQLKANKKQMNSYHSHRSLQRRLFRNLFSGNYGCHIALPKFRDDLQLIKLYKTKYFGSGVGDVKPFLDCKTVYESTTERHPFLHIYADFKMEPPRNDRQQFEEVTIYGCHSWKKLGVHLQNLPVKVNSTSSKASCVKANKSFVISYKLKGTSSFFLSDYPQQYQGLKGIESTLTTSYLIRNKLSGLHNQQARDSNYTQEFYLWEQRWTRIMGISRDSKLRHITTSVYDNRYLRKLPRVTWNYWSACTKHVSHSAEKSHDGQPTFWSVPLLNEEQNGNNCRNISLGMKSKSIKCRRTSHSSLSSMPLVQDSARGRLTDEISSRRNRNSSLSAKRPSSGANIGSSKRFKCFTGMGDSTGALKTNRSDLMTCRSDKVHFLIKPEFSSSMCQKDTAYPSNSQFNACPNTKSPTLSFHGLMIQARRTSASSGQLIGALPKRNSNLVKMLKFKDCSPATQSVTERRSSRSPVSTFLDLQSKIQLPTQRCFASKRQNHNEEKSYLNAEGKTLNTEKIYPCDQTFDSGALSNRRKPTSPFRAQSIPLAEPDQTIINYSNKAKNSHEYSHHMSTNPICVLLLLPCSVHSGQSADCPSANKIMKCLPHVDPAAVATDTSVINDIVHSVMKCSSLDHFYKLPVAGPNRCRGRAKATIVELTKGTGKRPKTKCLCRTGNSLAALSIPNFAPPIKSNVKNPKETDLNARLATGKPSQNSIRSHTTSSYSRNTTPTNSGSDQQVIIRRRSSSRASIEFNEECSRTQSSIRSSETDWKIDKTISKTTSSDKSPSDSRSGGDDLRNPVILPEKQKSKRNKCYCKQLYKITTLQCGCKYEIVPKETSYVKRCSKQENCQTSRAICGCTCVVPGLDTHGESGVKSSRTGTYLASIDEKNSGLQIAGGSLTADRITENLHKSDSSRKSASMLEEVLHIPNEQLPSTDPSASSAKSPPVPQGEFCYRHPNDPVKMRQSDSTRSLANTISEEPLDNAIQKISREQDSTEGKSNTCECKLTAYSCTCYATCTTTSSQAESSAIVHESPDCKSVTKPEGRRSICRPKHKEGEQMTRTPQVVQTSNRQFATSQIQTKLEAGKFSSDFVILRSGTCCTARCSCMSERCPSHKAGTVEQGGFVESHSDSTKAKICAGQNSFKSSDSYTSFNRVVSNKKNLEETKPKLFETALLVDHAQTVKTFVTDSTRNDRCHPFCTLPLIKQPDINKQEVKKTGSYCVGYESGVKLKPKHSSSRSSSISSKNTKSSCVDKLEELPQKQVEQARSKCQRTISSKVDVSTSCPSRTASCCRCFSNDSTLSMTAHQRAHHRMEQARTLKLENDKTKKKAVECSSQTSTESFKHLESPRTETTTGQTKGSTSRVKNRSTSPSGCPVPCCTGEVTNFESLNPPCNHIPEAEIKDLSSRPYCVEKQRKLKSKNRHDNASIPVTKSKATKRPCLTASCGCTYQATPDLLTDKTILETTTCLPPLNDYYTQLNMKILKKTVSGWSLSPRNCDPWCLLRKRNRLQIDSGSCSQATSSWTNHPDHGCPLMPNYQKCPTEARCSTVAKKFDKHRNHDKFVGESLMTCYEKMCIGSRPIQYYCYDTCSNLKDGVVLSHTTSHSESVRQVPMEGPTCMNSLKSETNSFSSDPCPHSPPKITKVGCQSNNQVYCCNQRNVLAPMVIHCAWSSDKLLNEPITEMMISTHTTSVTMSLCSNGDQAQCCTPMIQPAALLHRSKPIETVICKCPKSSHIKPCGRLYKEDKLFPRSTGRSLSSCSSKPLTRTKSHTSCISRTQSLTYPPIVGCVCSAAANILLGVSTKTSQKIPDTGSRIASAPPLPRQSNPRSNETPERNVKCTRDYQPYKYAHAVCSPVPRCERKLPGLAGGLAVPEIQDRLKIRPQYLNDESTRSHCEREPCLGFLGKLHDQLERTTPVDLLTCETWARDDRTAKNVTPIPLSPAHLASMGSWIVPSGPIHPSDPTCTCRNPALCDIAVGSSSVKKVPPLGNSHRKDSFRKQIVNRHKNKSRTVNTSTQIGTSPKLFGCGCLTPPCEANAEDLCSGGCQRYLRKSQAGEFQNQRFILCPKFSEPQSSGVRMENVGYTRKPCTLQYTISCGCPHSTEEFSSHCNCPKCSKRKR